MRSQRMTMLWVRRPHFPMRPGCRVKIRDQSNPFYGKWGRLNCIGRDPTEPNYITLYLEV